MKSFLIAFLLVVSLSVNTDCKGQWVQTNGPYIQSVHCFVQSGATLYAGASNGVFFSNDNGASWTSVSAGLAGQSVQGLAVNGTTMLAGTRSGGIFRTTNNGTSWSEVFTGRSYLPIRALTVCGNNFFVGRIDSIFRSTDDGLSWHKTMTSLQGGGAISLIANGTTILGTTNESIFRSTDNGDHWKLDTIGARFASAYSFAAIGTNVFAVTFEGVFRSTFDGSSWDTANAGLFPYDLKLIASSGSTLIIGTGGLIYYSLDSGTSWKQTTPYARQYGTDSALAMIGSTLIAGTGHGIMLSSDTGETWTAPMNGYVHNLAVVGSSLFAGTAGGVFRSSDNGVSWHQTSPARYDPTVSYLASAGTTLFATFDDTWPHRSTDLGVTWDLDTAGYTATGMLCLYDQGKYLYAGAYNGISISSDDGLSWQNITGGIPFYQYVTGIASIGDNVYAGTNSGVYVSYSGSAWYLMDTGLHPFEQVLGLWANGSNLFVHTYLISRHNAGSGSWEPVNNGLTSNFINAFAGYGSSIFIGGDSGGIFLSTNNGDSWRSVSEGLPKDYYSNVYGLAFLGKYMFAATEGGGVWRRPIEEFFTAAEAAKDTQTVLFSQAGSETITITGDTSGYTVHRIDFVNNSGMPFVVTQAALTTTNNVFQISQFSPGIPDTLQPGEKFSMIVRFYGNTLDTASRDTIVLSIENTLTSTYLYLQGRTVAGSSSGVSQNGESLSSDFKVYPNPLSQSATISFSSPESGMATISVVNILGTEVARIFSGEVQCGEHLFSWDASGMAPGVYQCIVRMNGRVERVAMVVDH